MQETQKVIEFAETKMRPLFIWGQNECVVPDEKSLEYPNKPLFLKPLKEVWKYIKLFFLVLSLTTCCRKFPEFGPSTTLIIDHSMEKLTVNDPSNCVVLPPYTGFV